MARTLSSELQAVVATRKPAAALLLDLTVDGTPYYIADRTIAFGGEAYVPGLTVEGGLRYHRSLQLDGGAVKVENITRFMSVLQAQEFVQGSPAVLRRLYIEAEEALVIFDGVVADVSLDSVDATLRLVQRLDPTARRIPARTYGPLCAWRYKGAECGSVSAEPLCPKTFDACVVRDVAHRFSGFVHIDRELQESVPPAPVVAEPEPNEDFLANFHGAGGYYDY
jgi:hypothetical protein